MKPTSAPIADDRPILSLLHIRSPLTRVAYSVPVGSACLLLLAAGQMSVSQAGNSADTAQTLEASRLIWSPPGKALELSAQAGARGMVMLVSRQTLVRALPASLLADQMGIVLRQGLSRALAPGDAIVRLMEGVAAEKQDGGPGSREALPGSQFPRENAHPRF